MRNADNAKGENRGGKPAPGFPRQWSARSFVFSSFRVLVTARSRCYSLVYWAVLLFAAQPAAADADPKGPSPPKGQHAPLLGTRLDFADGSLAGWRWKDNAKGSLAKDDANGVLRLQSGIQTVQLHLGHPAFRAALAGGRGPRPLPRARRRQRPLARVTPRRTRAARPSGGWCPRAIALLRQFPPGDEARLHRLAQRQRGRRPIRYAHGRASRPRPGPSDLPGIHGQRRARHQAVRRQAARHRTGRYPVCRALPGGNRGDRAKPRAARAVGLRTHGRSGADRKETGRSPRKTRSIRRRGQAHRRGPGLLDRAGLDPSGLEALRGVRRAGSRPAGQADPGRPPEAAGRAAAHPRQDHGKAARRGRSAEFGPQSALQERHRRDPPGKPQRAVLAERAGRLSLHCRRLDVPPAGRRQLCRGLGHDPAQEPAAASSHALAQRAEHLRHGCPPPHSGRFQHRPHGRPRARPEHQPLLSGPGAGRVVRASAGVS